MRNPAESVPEPHRKADKQKLKQKLDFHFVVYLLVILITFLFATLKLQHQIDILWQMTAFCMPNNNGNGIVETGYFQLI
jgi:hypothetical protein